MTQDLPPYQYIVGFLGCIVAVIIIAHLLARMTGWQEK
jgi:hypothetical protein